MFIAVRKRELLYFLPIYLSGRFVSHLYWGYMAFSCQSKGDWFVGIRNPRKPETSNSVVVIRISLHRALFFLRECLSVCFFWNGMLWHSFKKNCILWGLGKWKISPTALSECGGRSSGKCVDFYLLTVLFLIAFWVGLLPKCVECRQVESQKLVVMELQGINQAEK